MGPTHSCGGVAATRVAREAVRQRRSPCAAREPRELPIQDPRRASSPRYISTGGRPAVLRAPPPPRIGVKVLASCCSQHYRALPRIPPCAFYVLSSVGTPSFSNYNSFDFFDFKFGHSSYSKNVYKYSQI